jgi:hypothetical protein
LFSKQADLVNTKTTQLSEFPIDMSTLKKTRTIQSIIRDYEANWQVIRWAVKAGSKTNQRTGQSRKTFIKSTEKKVEWYLGTHNRFTKRIVSKSAGTSNFSEFYLENGSNLIPSVIDTLKPLEQNFNVITLS